MSLSGNQALPLSSGNFGPQHEPLGLLHRPRGFLIEGSYSGDVGVPLGRRRFLLKRNARRARM